MTFKFNSGAGGSVKLNSRRFPSTGISAYQPTTSGGGVTLTWNNPGAGGSALFAGNANSWMEFSDSPLFALPPDAFTIEWYQNATSVKPFPRVWQFGAYPSTSMGVSIEGGGQTFYFWANGSPVAAAPLPAPIWGQVLHFAIVLAFGTLSIYVNGQSVYGAPFSGVLSSGGNYLAIGRGGTSTNDAEAFAGYVTNFRISNTNRYAGNFTPSTTPLAADALTVFLFREPNSPVEGAWTGTVTNHNASSESSSPFPL